MYVFKVRKSWREWHLWGWFCRPFSILRYPFPTENVASRAVMCSSPSCVLHNPRTKVERRLAPVKSVWVPPRRGSAPLPIWSRVVITAFPIAHTSHFPSLSTLYVLIKASQQTYPQFTAKDTEVQKVKVTCSRSMICVTHLCSHDAEICSCI